MDSNTAPSGRAAITALEAIGAEGFGDRGSRLAVLDAARRLVTRLETASEQASRLSFDQPVIFAAVQVLVDVGIWEAWAESGGGERNVGELARLAKTAIEKGLVRRLMRVLAAAHLVDEVGEDLFIPTGFSLGLGHKDGELRAIVQAGTDHYLDAGRHLPAFLRKTMHKQSTDPGATAYGDMPSNTQHLTFFARCQSDAGYYASFSGHMAAWTRWKQDWTDTMDINRLLDGADLSQGPLVVDMGGHHGLDLCRVLAKEPSLPAGSLVLQDLAEVIEVAKTKNLDSRISTQAFDLFKQQPVINSRAYLMHAVLHDWPDHAVLDILQKLKPAMKKGYSKLVVVEVVIQPTGASLMQAVMDVQMMTLLASLERTQGHWSELLTKGGFANISFHVDAIGLEAVIEADVG